MLWTILVVLFVLWFLGVVTSYTLGGFIHILLAVAIIMVLVQFIQGQTFIVAVAPLRSAYCSDGSSNTILLA